MKQPSYKGFAPLSDAVIDAACAGDVDAIDRNLIRYSMQLAFLNQLLRKQLITDKEYSLIKNRLMKDYKVVSNLLT